MLANRRAYGGRKILRNAVPTPFPLGKTCFPVTIILFLCVRFPDLARSTVGSLAAQAWVLPSLFLSRFPYGSPFPGGEDPPPCRRRSLSPVRRLRHTTATLPTSGAQCNRRVRVAVADASALWRESSGHPSHKRAFSQTCIFSGTLVSRRAYGGRKILRNAVPTPFTLGKT